MQVIYFFEIIKLINNTLLTNYKLEDVMTKERIIYDIAFMGHYTKDTIVSSTGTRVVDGGAFNYGANVAARMGLKVAAITRLAKEDLQVVEKLKHLGVDVFSHISPQSTCLRLEYPTSDVDERVIYVTSLKMEAEGPFQQTIKEVDNLILSKYKN